MSNSYWDKVLDRRVTRRRGLALAGGSAAAAAFLAACGGGDDDDDSGTTDGGGGAANPGTPVVGGKLIWQGYGDPGGGLELIKSSNNGVLQLSSLTHDGLLDFAYGQPKYPGIGSEVLPSLSQALPEISPDKLTITVKLRPAKFHNGRDLTSEDVKWTFDTMAFAAESAYKNAFSWLSSFEAPDKSTIVLKAKAPNADTLESLAFKAGSGVAILAREHHESGAAEKSLMGSGPFTFVEYNPPLVISYKRNPNYITDQGKPYFDAIDRLGTSDSEKKVADIIAKQVHVTYWFPAEERERIKAQRKDINLWQYPRAGAGNLYFRNDVAPFSDKRVRQALSMGYDRTLLINSVAAGEGQADQSLSRSGTAWEFRGPENLPRKDLYVLNVAEAKKLLQAAGVTLPLKFQVPHWNSTVIGQKFVDEITSIATQWRNNGIADAQQLEETFGQFSPRSTGTYDAVHWGPNTTSTLPNLGISIRDKYFSPPTGPKAAPTINMTYVNNPTINDLVTKQLGEFDRKARLALFKQLEEVISEEMVHASGVTGTLTYMTDPSVKNAQMPRDAYNGGVPWMKHWWFGKA